jgi:hypothetical protein
MHVVWDSFEIFVFVFAREKGIRDFVATTLIIIYNANFEDETFNTIFLIWAVGLWVLRPLLANCTSPG